MAALADEIAVMICTHLQAAGLQFVVRSIPPSGVRAGSLKEDDPILGSQSQRIGPAQVGVEFRLGMDCIVQVLALELLTFGMLTWKKTHFSSRSDSLV